jgi:hypothetical protein
MAPSPLKAVLEDLLRARRLQDDGPPLRGEDRRGTRISTAVPAVDDALGGGFPRGQVSEIHGATSSGRTGLLLAGVARLTRAGSLVAWVDPYDRLDPSSAQAAGVDLARVLWIRGPSRHADGRALPAAVSALGTVLGSGIFEMVVFDVAGAPAAAMRRLPGTTWIRLQRLVEDQPVALVLLADAHVSHGPGGVTLGLTARAPEWSGTASGRLLRGLGCEVRAGRTSLRGVPVRLQANS